MQIALTLRLNNCAWDSGILHVALHTMGFPGVYIARKILLKWNKATNIENPKHVVCASLSSQSEISLWNVHLAKELNNEDVRSLNRNLVQKSSTEILVQKSWNSEAVGLLESWFWLRNFPQTHLVKITIFQLCSSSKLAGNSFGNSTDSEPAKSFQNQIRSCRCCIGPLSVQKLCKSN